MHRYEYKLNLEEKQNKTKHIVQKLQNLSSDMFQHHASQKEHSQSNMKL